MFDIQVSDLGRLRGVVSFTAIRQYIWYGELQWKIYNEVDRTFGESINKYFIALPDVLVVYSGKAIRTVV